MIAPACSLVNRRLRLLRPLLQVCCRAAWRALVLARAAREEWRTRFTLERYQNDVLALLESAQERAKKQSRHDRQDGGRSDHCRVTEA